MALSILAGLLCGIISGLGIGGGSILMVWMTAFVGLGSTLLCLLLFGPEKFLLPAMLCILGLLTLLRSKIGEGEAPV